MVGLLFAEKHDGVTSFRQAPIDPYGGSETEWPNGFFDVSEREAQALVANGAVSGDELLRGRRSPRAHEACRATMRALPSRREDRVPGMLLSHSGF